MREAWNGIRTSPADRKFVHYLTRLVRSGHIFCPISAATFSELMKIGDPGLRAATAQAIEELSLGVSLLPESDRVAAEVEGFFRSSLGLRQQTSSRWVWTRLA